MYAESICRERIISKDILAIESCLFGPSPNRKAVGHWVDIRYQQTSSSTSTLCVASPSSLIMIKRLRASEIL